MASVFISYRREDSSGWAGRLAGDLRERFGPGVVFQDIDTIGAGEDFVTAIEAELGSCSAVLVLIGPEWVNIKGEDGIRRLEDPSDTVRLEVAKALQLKDVLVIPVLVGGASMPGARDVPDELNSLARRNALELSDKRWTYDLELLIQSLVKNTNLTCRAKHVPPGIVRRRLLRLGAILCITLAAAGSGIYWLLAPKRAFEAFSIDSPTSGQEIPLGASQTRIVEGILLLTQQPPLSGAKPKIEIEVMRLPDRDPVFPQQGKVRYSTDRGHWRFESVRFPGQGEYEIIANVSLENGSTDFRSVVVKCLPKAAAFQRAIAKDREIRGASALHRVTLQPAELAELKRELHVLQEDFFSLYPGDLSRAEANLAQTLDLLDPVLPAHPDDWYLQNVRAYTFKNYAMVMRDRGDGKEFNRALLEAEAMFQTIREQKPDDAGAWNGLGSVALLRRDPERALVYIDRALDLQPDYKEAEQDRKIALKMLTQMRGSGP